MNKNKFAGKWHELKGKIRENWGKLTHDEVEMVDGKTEKLSGLLQKKYGLSKEQAEREINQLCESCESCESSEYTPRNKTRGSNEPAWSQEGNEPEREFNREDRTAQKRHQASSREHGTHKEERHPNAQRWNEQEKKRKAG